MTWRFSKHPGFLILGQILWLAQANNCRSTFFVCNFSSKVRILGSFAKIPLGPANIAQNSIFFCGVYDNSQTLSFPKMPGFLILGLNIINMSAIFMHQSLFRRLQFRGLNWNSLKGDQGKAAPNPIVYFR